MMEKNKVQSYHILLKNKLDVFVNEVYDLTQQFPKEEMYGIISQLRRAALSIVLNYIEGYARQRKLVMKNFLEISYRSLKEAQYLLYFSYKRKYINQENYELTSVQTDEIGKMIWGILSKL